MTANRVLTLKKGRTAIEVWSLGARLNAATWDGEAGLLDGSDSVEEAVGAKLNHGSVAGPVANRIAGGRARIAGVDYAFERNENGKTLLHSGAKSTRDAVWTVSAESDDAATLTLHLPHTADDFPGNRILTAQYRVVNDGFDLTFSATSDAPTLVNLALHPYWCLGTDRAGLRLQINADRYLPVDGDKIPTGVIPPVQGSIFDLRKMATPSPDIDHNYCFEGEKLKRIATLTSDRVTLDIDSDAPGLQVFTGKPIGIALEPQHWPDAPHHEQFPSILLSPGEIYSQFSRYRFSRPA